MIIVNLTQHKATPEQQAAGVVDLEGEELEYLVRCLTFDDIPNRAKIRACAFNIAQNIFWAKFEGARAAMIGGAPWLMGPLAAALKARGIKALFAFSVREAIEQTMPDGSVRKTAVFRHKGFVEAL